MSAQQQYITDHQGNKVAVIVPIADYEKLVEKEAISSRNEIAEQQLEEGKIKTHEQAKEQLSKWLKK